MRMSEAYSERHDILIVDDDQELVQMLTEYLLEQGFFVRRASDGVQMQSMLAAKPADLILLDIMLPGEDGLSLARRIQPTFNGAIIMLSARGEAIDRVVGLELGCDDYIPKPFLPRELLARIRAVLRRKARFAEAPRADQPINEFKFGPYRLLLDARVLMCGNDEVTLTTGEFDLLAILLRHPGKVLTRDQLVTLAEGHERLPFDRSIDVRVVRLRRKIEADPANPLYIRTVRGVGYLFSPGGVHAHG